jgi:signal transduction histidine kinase
MISEKIVKEFGGEININSVVGQGTTFLFNIILPENLVEINQKDNVSNIQKIR